MPKPTEAMQSEAQRGLDWRKEFGRGGTAVGISRARDIVNGADLSADTIGRMVSFFARHEVDKKGQGFSPGEKGYPSNGRIAWALWGGDPGKSWAEKEYRKMNQSADRAVILEGIKQAIHEQRKVVVDLREASALTGSGTGKGGRTTFDQAFATARYVNPFRQAYRPMELVGSDALFAAKTGNALSATPWGYTPGNDAGTPNVDTAIWQLPVRAVSARLPIRSAVLSDVNGLEESIVEDLVMEWSQVEAASMAVNNDQAGSLTTATGATAGLRGLDMYTSAGTAAFGSSGTAITNGIHSISTQAQTAGGVVYNDIAALSTRFPGQYWAMPGTAWHIRPSMIESLREMKDLQGLPVLLEVGEDDGGAVGRIFGWPVVPNPYLSTAFPIYLANWPRFLTIGDEPEISIQMMDQTSPGFITMYAEKRVVSTVRDPFAGVRMSA